MNEGQKCVDAWLKASLAPILKLEKERYIRKVYAKQLRGQTAGSHRSIRYVIRSCSQPQEPAHMSPLQPGLHVAIHTHTANPAGMIHGYQDPTCTTRPICLIMRAGLPVPLTDDATMSFAQSKPCSVRRLPGSGHPRYIRSSRTIRSSGALITHFHLHGELLAH